MKNANTKAVAANVAAPAAPVAKRAPRAAVKKAEFVGPVAAPVKADPMAHMLAQADVANKIAAQEKAEKAAAPKKERTTRPAQKAVEKKESAIVANVSALPVKFVITGMSRPVAGRLLFAHTEAFMILAGMYKGGAADRKALADIIGTSAINYHTKTKGNFVATPKGIELTTAGVNFFKARGAESMFDPKDVEAYIAILSNGKADERLVKNQDSIRAIKA